MRQHVDSGAGSLSGHLLRSADCPNVMLVRRTATRTTRRSRIHFASGSSRPLPACPSPNPPVVNSTRWWPLQKGESQPVAAWRGDEIVGAVERIAPRDVAPD